MFTSVRRAGPSDGGGCPPSPGEWGGVRSGQAPLVWAPVVVNELCAAPISHAQVVYLRGNELLFQALSFFSLSRLLHRGAASQHRALETAAS